MAIKASHRVLSVDVLRGVTIAFMILVNDPGDRGHAYAQLNHSEWSGWTMTDMVFPFFLFIIGASIIFSLQSRIARGDSRIGLAGHMIRRAAIIFGLDLFIAAYPHYNLTHLRIYGVLTRIAVCYLAAGLICLVTRKISHLAIIVATLLVGYWVAMRFVPVPGFGIPTHDMPILDELKNLASWIDRGFTAFLQRTIHTGSLYRGISDPEGILGMFPSIATTLIGSITAIFMRNPDYTPAVKRNAFAIAGVLSIVGGELWNISFPINKNLWTSSFVLFMAGVALLGLSLFYWVLDMLRLQEKSSVARAALWPWLVFGSNAIVAYVVAELLSETLSWIKVSEGGSSITLQSWIYLHGFSHGNSTAFTSLLFALVYVAVCFLPNWLLWRKQIFVKI